MNWSNKPSADYSIMKIVATIVETPVLHSTILSPINFLSSIVHSVLQFWQPDCCISQPLFQSLATQQQSSPSAPIPFSSRELQVSLVFIVSATNIIDSTDHSDCLTSGQRCCQPANSLWLRFSGVWGTFTGCEATYNTIPVCQNCTCSNHLW